MQACAHLDFIAQLYLDQLADGWYFLHDHLVNASPCDLDCMKRLRGIASIHVVRGD